MNLDLMHCNLPSQPTTQSASQSKSTLSSRPTQLVRPPSPRVKIILSAPQQKQTFPSVPVLLSAPPSNTITNKPYLSYQKTCLLLYKRVHHLMNPF